MNLILPRLSPTIPLVAVFLAAICVSADEPTYEQTIAPLFKEHCVRCHNGQMKKADLDLSSPAGLFRGGESGVVIEIGNASKSSLYEMLHEDLMPPPDDRKRGLKKEEVALIKKWLDSGAPFEDGTNPKQFLISATITNHQIEPLLRLRCATCHGLRKREGGLDVRTRASLLKGGKSGPAIVLGAPEKSLLLKQIHSGAMPPKELLVKSGVRPMTSGEIERLAQWIEGGAPEITIAPDVAGKAEDTLVSDADRKFWSFQSLKSVKVPELDESQRVRNEIDAFVLRRLREQGLDFAEEADKLTLLRRATFDLTGLPPEPEVIEQYLKDDDPLAYEKLIDRLLDSPRYGERWAQHWLDAAGYADSEGKRSADPIRPYAYRYRDYIIRSLNADKPYSRFLMEQIAGDELVDVENAKSITSEMIDNLIATGFLRLAPDGTGSDIVNTVSERMEVVSDEIDIFSSTVLGLTMKCARCHSHKYDPLPQRDYYRLAAIFKGAMDEHDWLKPVSVPGQTKSDMKSRYLDYMTAEEEARLAERKRDIEKEIESQKAKLAELAAEIRKQHRDTEIQSIPKVLRSDLLKTLATKKEARNEIQKYLASKFEKRFTLTDKQVKSKEGYKRPSLAINRIVKQLESEKSERPKIRALWDRGSPSPTYVYVRGDFRVPGKLVGPGVPSVLTDGRTSFVAKPPWLGSKKTGRRLALAKWLVDSSNPLTSRVMVNRVWRHHFGRGIVASVDNFGKLGTRPTHPELLDWLARRFMNDGWSLKALHRLMMTSTVYRQSSRKTSIHERRDPDNLWLARMPLRRAEAEVVRDSLLFVAGALDERPYGRPDAVNVRGDGLVTSIGEKGSWRRSVYVRHRRREMPSVLETFDLPQLNPACQERPSSTVAQQSLYLLNNAAIRDLADRFARRVQRQQSTKDAQIDYVYLVTLSRYPTEEEKKAGLSAMHDLEQHWKDHLKHKAEEKAKGDPRFLALSVYCHTLMNSAEFLFID